MLRRPWHSSCGVSYLPSEASWFYLTIASPANKLVSTHISTPQSAPLIETHASDPQSSMNMNRVPLVVHSTGHCKVTRQLTDRLDHVMHSESDTSRSSLSSHTNPNPHLVRRLHSFIHLTISYLRRHWHLSPDGQDSPPLRPSSKLPKTRITQLVGRRRKHAPPYVDRSLLFIGHFSYAFSLLSP